MSKEIKILIGIGLVVIVGGILLFSRQASPTPPGQGVDGELLIRANSHMTGKADAKVSVVEFGDYECPACATAEAIFERLRTEYKNNPNVNFVFRNFPLSQHKKAMISAAVAEAAGEQEKFWEMHDKIYLNQTSWIGPADHEATFTNFANEIGLDMNKFQNDYKSQKYTEMIAADQDDGEALGVNSTPTFFVNGEKATSYQYEYLKNLIEEKLK